jgi:hypothetical protein
MDTGSKQSYVEVQVSRHVRQLFDRLPDLAGFRLRNDLMVADVAAVRCSNNMPIRRLQVSVMQALVELVECAPEAISLMRGRTFARCTKLRGRPGSVAIANPALTNTP